MPDPFLLDHFGFLSVTGNDALRFLQGYTTCDLPDLGTNQTRPGAICNIKGRMVSNFHAVPIENGFLLRMTARLVKPTIEFLKKYIVFSKAELSDLSDTYYCYGLTEALDEFPQQLNTFTYIDEDLVICTAEQPMRFEIWSSEQRPTTNDVKPWMSDEFADGVAWVDETSTDSYLPQMFNQQAKSGISFDKGCYLGQEIVARMHYRGKLTKRLHRGYAPHAVNKGDIIFDSSQKSVGTIVTNNDQEFLAVIQTKSADDNRYHLADGTAVSVTDLQDSSQDQ